MTCSFYNDTINKCGTKFNFITPDVSPKFCKSKDHTLCPIYQIIEYKKSYCEYIEKCGYRFHRLNSVIEHNTDTFKRIMPIIFGYCLSDKHKECKRKTLIDKREYLPNDLLPDGSKLKFQDFLKKRDYTYKIDNEQADD